MKRCKIQVTFRRNTITLCNLEFKSLLLSQRCSWSSLLPLQSDQFLLSNLLWWLGSSNCCAFLCSSSIFSLSNFSILAFCSSLAPHCLFCHLSPVPSSVPHYPTVYVSWRHCLAQLVALPVLLCSKPIQIFLSVFCLLCLLNLVRSLSSPRSFLQTISVHVPSTVFSFLWLI